MRKVGLYMRVSTDRQARDGQSLEFQERILKEYIQEHPEMVLVGQYVDDGISGAKFDQRDELQRLLNDVAAGKVNMILFTRLDRFFRSVRHLMNTFDFLEKHGCEWRAIQEHHDNTSPTGKLALTIMAAFAQMESDMDSARVRDAIRHKISKKEWPNGSPPYGYKLVDKHAVPDPEKAEIARKLFADYARHGNISRLVREHIAFGCPRTNRGMKSLLQNRAYIGEMYGVPDYLEPIIDRAVFDNTARLLSMNIKQSQKYTYLFTGLMICPDCGRKMGASLHHGKMYAQYRCAYRYVKQCSGRTHSERKIEDYLLSTVKSDIEQRTMELKAVKQVDNSQKINALYRKMDRLKDLYVESLIDMNTYKADLEKYRAELNALEQPQETRTDHFEMILQMNVFEIYKTLTREEKRRLWRSVIRSITPQDDGTFFIEYM